MKYVEALSHYELAFDRAFENMAVQRRPLLSEYFKLHKDLPEVDAQLALAETGMQTRLPSSLRSVWKNGGFHMQSNSSSYLEVFSLSRCQSWADKDIGWATLGHILSSVAASEFARANWPSDLSALWTDYFVWGQSQQSDSDSDFFVMDRRGHLGLVQYRHEWRYHNGEAWCAEYESLATGKLRLMEADTHLTAEILLRVEALREWADT